MGNVVGEGIFAREVSGKGLSQHQGLHPSEPLVLRTPPRSGVRYRPRIRCLFLYYALHQVPWLIHIEASNHSNVVGKQLQRNDLQNRCQ